MKNKQLTVSQVTLLGANGQKLCDVEIEAEYAIVDVVEHAGRFFTRNDDNGEVFGEVKGKRSIREVEEGN